MTAAGFAFAASGALPVEKLAADVVVVGAGGTGVAAAASAAQHGAKVIVFEKMPFIGGAACYITMLLTIWREMVRREKAAEGK